jgi:hypothetical protein
MHNQHGRSGIRPRGKVPADEFTARIMPWLEPVLPSHLLRRFHRKGAGHVDQLALKKHHEERQPNVKNQQCDQPVHGANPD